MRKLIVGLILLLMACLISGCSTTIKEQKKVAIKNVSEVFSSQPKTAKESAKQIKFYLPFGMHVNKKSPNNIIINRGKQSYILFYNQKEDKKSHEIYEISKPNKGLAVDKQFTTKKKFGYLLISKVKKNLYEVTAGIGGIKMTTETSMDNIADDAERMMTIVNSASYKK
ncbi:hypothetical protein [Bacillus sp. FJAT-49736]|uniref:hypothetical protein n=1 Tax=Bacillus sp. FJAT-49736 TaxID=2833582 RepID=UPI001BCA0CD5|nr:hypothetical protein [Bacillus sp. FJAT-49736]MBS4173856.1 hypothetical protein [Bacillus sp. FJAT-49736]